MCIRDRDKGLLFHCTAGKDRTGVVAMLMLKPVSYTHLDVYKRQIYVRKLAPFGDPVEVTVRGYELSLRKQDAEIIEIE